MTEQSNKQGEIVYTIKRVKELSFSINERLFIPGPENRIQLELGQLIGFNPDLNLANFTLKVFFHYNGTPTDILADIQVENIFEIQDIKGFMTVQGIVILPSQLITNIVGISISHTRALLSKNLAGTIFQDLIIPITDPWQVAKHFYPYMFDQETPVITTDSKGKEKNQKMVNVKKKKTPK